MNYFLPIVFFVTFASTGTDQSPNVIKKLWSADYYNLFSSDKIYKKKTNVLGMKYTECLVKSQDQIITDFESFAEKCRGDANTVITKRINDTNDYCAITLKHMYMNFIWRKEIKYNNKVIDTLARLGMRFSGVYKTNEKNEKIVCDNLFFDILTRYFEPKKLSQKISLAKICIHTVLDPLKNKQTTVKKRIAVFLCYLKHMSKKHPSLRIIPKPLIALLCNETYGDHPDILDISNALTQISFSPQFEYETPLNFIIKKCNISPKDYKSYDLQLFDPQYWQNNCMGAMKLCAPINAKNCIIF